MEEIAYNYYTWEGFGPLAGAVAELLKMLLPASWMELDWLGMILIFGSLGGMLFFIWLYAEPYNLRAIWRVVPLFLIGFVSQQALLWSLPIYLTVYLGRNRYPYFSGALAAFTTLMGIHPLLSMLLCFYSMRRKEFLLGILIGGLLGLWLPFVTYSPSQYGAMLGEWYSTFRAPVPEHIAKHTTPSFSLMTLLRATTSWSPRLLWLLLVNLFHLLLLPTLRHGTVEERQEVAPIFLGSVLTFMGFTSEWSNVYTLALPLTGIYIWGVYSEQYLNRLRWLLWKVALWGAYLLLMFACLFPSFYKGLAPTMGYVVPIFLGLIQILQIRELWLRRAKHRSTT